MKLVDWGYRTHHATERGRMDIFMPNGQGHIFFYSKELYSKLWVRVWHEMFEVHCSIYLLTYKDNHNDP
jgi:hypothetical protein